MVWQSLVVALIAPAIIIGTTAAVGRSRRRNKEKRMVRYLRAHTEDLPGKQYISITSVAQGIGLDVSETTEAADRSPVVFRSKADESMIGLYEQARSVYEERGVLRL